MTYPTDPVEQLRYIAKHGAHSQDADDRILWAADKIEQLEAVITELRYFLNNDGVPFDHWGKGCPDDCDAGTHRLHKEVKRLRAIEQRAERYCISATVTQHELAILKGILNG